MSPETSPRTSDDGTAPESVRREVHDATTRYLQTLDGLTDNQLAEPSLLPGWTRGHVVAHLANHALGVARALAGLRLGTGEPMYDSDAARDADIETAAALPRAELRELTRSTIERLADELRLVISYEGHVERTPGGQVLSVGELFCIRWRELEIHHADLGASYTRRNWPSTFVDYLFPVVVWDRGASESLVLRTPEGDVPVGAGDGPVVAGTRVDLTWWLLGRGTGEGLTGTLPTLGPWTRRTPAR